MTSKPPKQKRVNRTSLLMKVSVCMLAITGTLYFLSQYRDWAKTTREVSLDSNEPTLAVSSNKNFRNEVQFREDIRDRDEQLLEELRQRKIRLTEDLSPSIDSTAYAEEYLRETLSGLRQLPPEAVALGADLHRSLTDADMQHAVPPPNRPARVASGP